MNDDQANARRRLEAELAVELAALETAGLRRSTEGGHDADLLDFVSNDYLGLARDPAVAAAAAAAAMRRGAGAGAARLLGGGIDHDEVETAVASWLGAEAALFFPTGFQANLGVLSGLCDRRDAIVSDELNHASIIDACRLARARVEVYRHGDLDSLGRALERTRGARRAVVVTETVFGMDGDLAPLAGIHELCKRFDARLLLDEAHALGVIGAEGRGAWHDSRLDPSLLLGRIVTGGKALGVAGGFFVGDRVVRESLLHRARSFVFTTAAPPSISGALIAAIARARTMDAERDRVRTYARRIASALGLPEPAAAIVPVVIGDSTLAMRAARACQEHGFDVRAVRPPTVPEGTSRLRISLHANHRDADVDRLISLLRSVLSEITPPRAAPAPNRRGSIVVCGTDTGVGKTVVSALLVRALARRGPARYFKPVQTGDESDTASVAALAGLAVERAAPPALEFRLPASPHTAAKAEGRTIDEQVVIEALKDRIANLEDGATLVVELAGGILVPYRIGFDQGDLLRTVGLPVVLVARSGLGTLNHTGLSIEALERRGVRIAAIFVVGDRHEENVATLRALNPAIPLFEVPRFEPLEGRALERWIDLHPSIETVAP